MECHQADPLIRERVLGHPVSVRLGAYAVNRDSEALWNSRARGKLPEIGRLIPAVCSGPVDPAFQKWASGHGQRPPAGSPPTIRTDRTCSRSFLGFSCGSRTPLPYCALSYRSATTIART